MHRAVVLSVFSSAFLVLATLSGTTGNSGIQPINTSYEDGIPLAELSFQQTSFPRNPDDQMMKYLKPIAAKKGWKDLHGGGWGKRDLPDTNNLSGLKNSLASSNYAFRLPMNHDFKGTSTSGLDLHRRFYPNEKELEPNAAAEGVQGKSLFNKFIIPSVPTDFSKFPGFFNGETGKRDWILQGSWEKGDLAWPSSDGVTNKRGNSKWERLNGGWG